MKIEKTKNIKVISSDFALSITASFISAGVLQLVVYPLLASSFDSSIYGLLLTIMGIVNTIGVSLGNSLNNTRLILKTKYIKKQIVGDFNFILLYANLFGFIAVIIVGLFIFDLSLFIIVLLAILILLLITKTYVSVYFRLKLDFKKLLIGSIIMSIGYLIGGLLGAVLHLWPLAFIFGNFFSIVYILYVSKFYKEPVSKTEFFNVTLRKYLILVGTSIFTNLLLYMDRVLIFPILGSDSVATYTVASFIGKSIGIVLGPIASVILGYYAKEGFKMSKSKFWKINLLFFIIALMSVPFIYFLSPFITKMLYPSIFDAATPYILVANLAAILGILARMIQPAILKFCPTYWQIIKEIIFGTTYLVLGIFLMRKYGLTGLVITIVVSNILKIIILLLLGNHYLDDKRLIAQ